MHTHPNNLERTCLYGQVPNGRSSRTVQAQEPGLTWNPKVFRLSRPYFRAGASLRFGPEATPDVASNGDSFRRAGGQTELDACARPTVVRGGEWGGPVGRGGVRGVPVYTPSPEGP